MLSTITITKSSIIVVVDDECDIVELFSEALKSEGCDVIAFTDPRMALSTLSKS